MLRANKYFSWLLIAIFGYILTPFALIHEFHDHHDTHCNPGALSFDSQHIHCKILQIDAQIFTSPGTEPAAWISETFVPYTLFQPITPSCAAILFADLRAPPVS
jgi:hypothetical protein